MFCYIVKVRDMIYRVTPLQNKREKRIISMLIVDSFDSSGVVAVQVHRAVHCTAVPQVLQW